MNPRHRLLAIASLDAAMIVTAGAGRGMAEPRAHVYLFRGLADVFSLGMDTLADELNKRGVDASSHSHTDWQSIAAKVTVDFKAGKQGPIILIGHSLGADAAIEMADRLGDKGVPVALVVPFDGTQSFPIPGNVARVINFTQRDYAFMRPGPGFHGSLNNVDLRGDPNIGHLNIDEVPALHSQVIAAVLAIVGGHPAVAALPKPGSAKVHDLPEPAAEKMTPPTSGPASPPPAPPNPPSPPKRSDPIQIPD
jgi:hypothetical protein